MATEADAAVSPTIVAWNWIIEALAELKECHFLTLKELISSVPGVLKDPSSGAAARERVALRLLEECVGFSEDAMVPPSLLNEEERDSLVIDVNERCEDVLCRFMLKVNSLDRVEMSKDLAQMHGLRKFILQKKATLPKLSLSLLKEAEDAHECTLVGGNGFVQRDVQNIVSTNHDHEHGEVMKAAKDIPVTVLNGAALQNNSSEHKRHLTETALVGHGDLFSADGDGAHPERQAEKLKSPEHNTNGYKDEYADGIKKNLLSSNMQVQSDVGHDKVSDAPSDEDGSVDAALTLDAHKKILLAEKCKILRSQHSQNHGLLSEDGTENKMCIKCDEGGQLLLCVEDDCPITIHGSCLGSSICFDDKGKFRCPFCSYIQAVTSYYSAKKKVTAARKTLSSFISSDPIKKRSSQEQISSKNPGSLEKLDGESHSEKDNVNIDMNNPDHAIDDMQCIDDRQETLLQRLDVINCDGFGNANSAGNHNLLVVGDNNNDGRCMGCERRQQVENNIAGDSLDNDNDQKSQRTDNHKHPIELQNQEQEQPTTSCSHHTTSEEMAGEEVATKRRKKDIATKRRKKDIHTPEEGTSSKYKTSKSYAKRYANSVWPFGRRNKLPWTMEEEAALKDALQKFPQSSKGGFPWTKIFEHGRHVFHRTRQPMDLKDKWRNIQKKEKRALSK